MNLTLPTDSKERKEYPLYRGLFAYFPAALAAVARHSKRSNDKHNPGEPMHHARGKSTDHDDCILRHTMDLGDLLAAYERDQTLEPAVIDSILYEATARAWRSLASLQELCERFAGAPLAPNARLPVPVPEALAYEDERAANMYAVGFRDGMAEGAHAAELAADDITPTAKGFLRRDPWTPGCDRVVGRCRCGGVH